MKLMKKISDRDLESIKGGFTLNIWVILGIIGTLVFLSGVAGGISNPEKCNS